MSDMGSLLSAWRQNLLADVRSMIAAALGDARPPARIVDVPVVLGVRGTALAAGAHVFLRLGLNGQATVLTWSLAASVAGVSHSATVAVDVQTGTTLAGVATICSSGRPSLSAQAERSDIVPSGWSTVAIADPSWVYFSVLSPDGTVEVVSLTLRLAVSPR